MLAVGLSSFWNISSISLVVMSVISISLFTNDSRVYRLLKLLKSGI